jgi:DNA-binding transcriptional ArsR family regulator
MPGTTTRRDVFQAIADPTRREIIGLIANKPMNLNAIADNFDISRPAISQHIKVLHECGLIEIEDVGRERYCKIRPSQLIPAFLWLEQYKGLWSDKLDSFERYLNKLQAKTTKHGKRKRK